MNLLVLSLANEIDEMNQNGVRLQTIGNIEGMPKNAKKAFVMLLIKPSQIKKSHLFLH